VFATLFQGVATTCPTFVAWLDSSKNKHTTVIDPAYVKGFVAVTVAPDHKSVIINWQLEGAKDVQMMSAGIFGPATKEQEKPMASGVLLDMGIMNPGPTSGNTLTIRKKVQSEHMEDILTWMREGRAYVNVMTTAHPSGEVRGQLVVPRCLDGELTGPDHYGFANIMISPDSDDKSVAVLIQAAPDTTGVQASLVIDGTSDLLTVDVRNEIKADAAVDAGLQYHVLSGSSATVMWTALSRTGQMVKITTSSGAGLMGEASKAHACRLLSSVEDTLFTTAKEWKSDWLTVWSMNPGNPDHRRTLTPRYYAHPLEVTSGETAEAIMLRFGISEAELVRSNPAVMDLKSLSVGDTLCVVPNFRMTMSGNGAKICLN